MRVLQPGENVAPARGRCTVTVRGAADRRVVVVGADDRSIGEPSPLDPSGVLDPAAAPSTAVRLVVVGIGVAGPIAVEVLDAAGQQFAFTATPPAGSAVALLVEFYRRPDGSWKLRALGEGLADLDALHQIFGIPSTIRAAATPTISAPLGAAGHPPESAAPAKAVAPQQQRDWSRISSGVWEDASRSASTHAEASRHAGLNRDAELERLMGDPTARAADDPRRRQIESRHDDILERADQRRLAELDELIAELAELEAAVPAPLARWSSAAWERLPDHESAMVRTGELTRSDSSSLRIPMYRARSVPGGYLVMPWTAGDDGPARSLVRRLLAAGPAGRGLWVLSDDASVQQQWSTSAAGNAGRGIDASLAELAHRVDLADMAAEAGAPLPVDAALPSVVLMVLDGTWVPDGEVADTVGQLRRVAILGPRYGMSVLFLAPDDLRNSFGDGVPGSLLPLVPARIDDPWVGLGWDFAPDDGTPADEIASAIDLRAQRRS